MYPAFGPGKEFHLDWMALIVARNLIATWVICGFWDWFLYFSPLQVVLGRDSAAGGLADQVLTGRGAGGGQLRGGI